MKRYYIIDLKEGTKIEDVFFVTSKAVQKARTGEPYIRFTLADKSGQISAMKWKATEADISAVSESDYVSVRGVVGTYNDKLQLTLDSLRPHKDAIDPLDFISASENDPDKMMSELGSILASIKSAPLRSLLAQFFNDPDFVIQFKDAPAAKKNHHAYLHGLLEHTLNVVKLCCEFAKFYPQIDRDLLIAGAALHDIGKIKEYKWNGGISQSDQGILVGHISVATAMVQNAAENVDDLDPMVTACLLHMILSHHGRHDWGSPQVPCSYEAYALHMADDLDAKIGMFGTAIEESDNNGDDGSFTSWHPLLERRIFKGIRKPRIEKELPPLSEDPQEQLDVFAIDYDPFADD